METLHRPGNQPFEFSTRHRGSQVTPLICQCDPKSPRPAPPLLKRLTAGCECARGGLCSALLCSALEKEGRGAATQVGSGPGRSAPGNVSPSHHPRPLILCAGARTKFWSALEESGKDGAGGEMDFCDSPRGFVGARLVRFIRGERAMMMRRRVILTWHAEGFFLCGH